jgi:signal transduction histidine kinase
MSLRAPHDHVEFETHLKEAQTVTDELLERVEALSLDLRPTMLDDLGLFPTLLWHLDRFTGRTGVKVDFAHLGLNGQRFAPKIETAVYRIVQEALTNVARHAGVREAAVRIWADETQIYIQIEDNGCGFDVNQALSQGDSAGLSGMRERADLLEGRFSIESRPAAGTVIQAELPLIL